MPDTTAEMTLKKTLFTLPFTVICFLLLPAISATAAEADQAVEGLPLRIALTGKYPPFSFYDNTGELAGFDVDVSREIAKRINREPQITSTEWDGILAGLLAGKYDAIVSSMAITPERAEVVNFSEPYYRSGAQLFVHRENPSRLYDINECGGKRIAAVLGETYQHYLDEKHPEIDVVTLKSSVEIFDLLKSMRIDGFVSDKLVGLWQIKSAQRPFVPVGELLYSEDIAIPVRKEDNALLSQINGALRQMRADGTMQKIRGRYFGITSSPADGTSDGLPASVIVRKLASGFAVTLLIAASSLLVGFVFAVPCAIILNHAEGAWKLAYWPVRTIVDFLRGTPVLIQLLFAWMGLGLSPYAAAIGTLGVNSMAYMAEVIRSGLMSVDRGQILAGRALSLSRYQVFRYVVWPQAFRIALPPLMNSVVALTKDTALVAVISVSEVIREAQAIISVTFEPGRFYFIVAVMFFVVTFPLMKLAASLENKIRSRGFSQ
jgi:His/Glu/Gln/Arg/opine family amino acid ABC transporter permease subunit